MQKASGSRWLLLAVIVLSLMGASFGQIGISVSFGPPALPVYVQPVCPAPGYIWTPGYWAWDPNFGDYYWVPGTWVLAPVGLLWTPPWWGWSGGVYLFHVGYWGPTIGFYGGINYGFGYFGHGYEGGRWNNGQFYYNRSVNNVNVTNIHNVYNVTVNNVTVNRVSYNGGPGGIAANPTAAEEAAARERHEGPIAAQNQQVEAARNNPQLRASANKGKPPIAATDKPGAFSGGGVERAKSAGAPYHPPAKGNAGETSRPNQTAASVPRPPENNPSRSYVPTHARNLPAPPAPTPRNTGNAQADKAYQQKQEQLRAQEEKEHEQLAQQQEQDHQRMAQQHATNEQMQQMERQHQQQTMQMEQRHYQEQQQMQRQAPQASHNEARPEAAKH